MQKIYSIIYLVFLIYCSTCEAQTQRVRTIMLMGSRFDITMVAEDSLTAEARIDDAIAEITRIENLISDWKADSQVSLVNNYAGIMPVVVDREVLELTQRALYFSEITSGAFDISYAAMDKIWKFDGSMTEMPTPLQIKKSVEKVAYRHIVIDSIKCTIFLEKVGMKIGFGSIGKGYAADKARKLVESRGVRAGIINASGDMAAWGVQPNGSEWNIGITNPFKPDKLIAIVPLSNGAVTTSGSYEKFVEFNGKRYSHIINPQTGYPATGIVSVSVFGPSAEVANGFSTSIMVLGRKAGLQLIAEHPEYSCLIITDYGKTIKSGNFRRNMRSRNRLNFTVKEH